MKADQPVPPPCWDQFLVPGTNLLNMLLAETCVGLSFFTKANYTCDSLVVLQGGERGGCFCKGCQFSNGRKAC